MRELAGPVVNALSTSAIERLASPLITTWPALAEAMYLWGDRAGWPGQDLLGRLIMRRDLVLHPLDEPALRRSRDLMKRYQSVPMDLADATLVAAAEELGATRIFTLDADFRIYRLKGQKPFELVP